jgi:uncharacterized protein YgiM (DUF1202 family)
MKKLAVMVLMASISLTACGNKAVKADSMEVMKNIEETTSIEEASSIEEATTIEETTSTEETSTIEETTSMEETSTIEEETSSIEETSNIPTEGTYTISESDMTMYTVKGCNIRQGASTEYDVIGTLSKGEAVKITGKVNEVNWYEISLSEDKKGYVSGSLLVSEKPAEEQVPSQPEQPAQPPQQPAQPEQPASSDAMVNPNTGEAMKPGESYIAPNGVKVTYMTDDILFNSMP